MPQKPLDAADGSQYIIGIRGIVKCTFWQFLLVILPFKIFVCIDKKIHKNEVYHIDKSNFLIKIEKMLNLCGLSGFCLY